MKKQPNPEKIIRLAQGAWITQTLYVAVDLEIFDLINRGKNTRKKISQKLKTSSDSTERLLNALVAFELLYKNELIYKNSLEAENFLIKGKSAYFGDMITHYATDGYQTWQHLKQSVISGSPVKILSEKMKNPKAAKDFTNAMHNNALAPAKVMAQKIDFSKYHNLLDIGGGSGAYSIVLTKHYPKLQAAVFDLPNVVKVAQGFIKKEKTKKVNTISGNFFQDEFPKKYDVVLISQILHSYNSDKCQRLIKKTYDSLLPKSLIIINEFLLDKQKTSPLYSVLFSLNMLINSRGGGSAYTFDEISDWLKKAGFTNPKLIPLIGAHKAIIAYKK